MQIFAEYYKQEPPTETAMLAYKTALSHLTPGELSMGCKEALKVCEFIPKAKEILAGLRAARERLGSYGHSPAEANEPMSEATAEEKAEMKQLWDDAWKKIGQIGKKATIPAVPAWDREPGLD